MFARRLVSSLQASVLEERARGMRCSPTASEALLWLHLRGSRTGFAFRRQLVVGNHVVDFACTKVRLVVEVDGGSHVGRARHDAARDARLGVLGWDVLRVTDREVHADVAGIAARIAARARERGVRAGAGCG